MTRKCAVTDTLLGDLSKCRLESRHKLALKLTVDLLPVVFL